MNDIVFFRVISDTMLIQKMKIDGWVSWFDWHINPCGLFNAKSCFYIYICK